MSDNSGYQGWGEPTGQPQQPGWQDNQQQAWQNGPQQQAWGSGPMQTQPVAQNTDAAGFFKALFDFSFSHFVTPKVVKFIYVLSMVAIGLMWLVWLVVAAQDGGALRLVFVLIIGPLVGLLYLTFIRMTLEFYLATVRMSEDIHKRLR